MVVCRAGSESGVSTPVQPRYQSNRGSTCWPVLAVAQLGSQSVVDFLTDVRAAQHGWTQTLPLGSEGEGRQGSEEAPSEPVPRTQARS